MAFFKNPFGVRGSEKPRQSDSGTPQVKVFQEVDAFDSLIPPHARLPLASPLENTAKQLAYLSALIGTTHELSGALERVQYCQDAVRSDPSRADMEQSLREEQKELAQRKSRLSDICDWLSASGAPASTVAEAEVLILQIGHKLSSQGGIKQMQIVIDRVFAIGALITPIGDIWGGVPEWANRKK